MTRPPDTYDSASFINLPVWVRAVVQVGLPSVLALALVYWTTLRVDTTQAQILREMPLRQQEHAEMLRTMQRNIEQSTILARYLRVLCVNGARTNEQVNECARVE